MFRRCRLITIVAAVALSTACTSEQTAGGRAAVVPPAQAIHRTFGAPAINKDCKGTGHVKVRPCPAVLKHSPGVTVKVKGPGVTQATWEGPASGCGDGICEYSQPSSTHFQIIPGPRCGTAVVPIEGLNADHQEVGVGQLEVVNRDCSWK